MEIGHPVFWVPFFPGREVDLPDIGMDIDNYMSRIHGDLILTEL